MQYMIDNKLVNINENNDIGETIAYFAVQENNFEALKVLVENGIDVNPAQRGRKFLWRWSIPMISLFLGLADFCYFTALAQDGALIAVVSMIRRGSVVVSFAFGALLLHEKNLKSKAVDVLLILVGLFFLYLGSK